ncbi:hypothetical protein B0H14DRAFT_3865282 [Mycena olivaceomarginata]|nr:hypothetical protein B0H14DRAFT_3865282 [Mycena olivaceomarginata]
MLQLAVDWEGSFLRTLERNGAQDKRGGRGLEERDEPGVKRKERRRRRAELFDDNRSQLEEAGKSPHGRQLATRYRILHPLPAATDDLIELRLGLLNDRALVYPACRINTRPASSLAVQLFGSPVFLAQNHPIQPNKWVSAIHLNKRRRPRVLFRAFPTRPSLPRNTCSNFKRSFRSLSILRAPSPPPSSVSNTLSRCAFLGSHAAPLQLASLYSLSSFGLLTQSHTLAVLFKIMKALRFTRTLQVVSALKTVLLTRSLDPATQRVRLINFQHGSALPLPFRVFALYNTDNALPAAVSTLLIVEWGGGETLPSMVHPENLLCVCGDETLGLDGDGSRLTCGAPSYPDDLDTLLARIRPEESTPQPGGPSR